jgi:hypothetical protein
MLNSFWDKILEESRERNLFGFSSFTLVSGRARPSGRRDRATSGA